MSDNDESFKDNQIEIEQCQSITKEPIIYKNTIQDTLKTSNKVKTASNSYSSKNEDYRNRSQAKEIQKGNLLEYRLKRLMFFMGYFSKVGVYIKTNQDEMCDTITDLDVFGYYIHKNFAIKTLWADCKAGQAKPLERLSWIIGVKSIAKIDDVIFVKKGVRTSTKQFAGGLGIQILELGVIEKLENDFKVETDDWSGSWNPKTQLNKLTTFQKISIPNNDTYKRMGHFISTGYWTFDSYTKIKKTITGLRQLSEIEQYSLKKEEVDSVHWAIFELINLLVLATLNVCGEVYYLSENDKKEIINEGLISGEISSKKREEIVEALYKTAYNIIQKQIPDFRGQLQFPSIGMNPPRYSDSFNDLILRITNNPIQYFDILRFLDYIFMEYDLQLKDIDESKLKKMFSNYNDLVISAKTILHFICSITGIRKDLFSFLR